MFAFRKRVKVEVVVTVIVLYVVRRTVDEMSKISTPVKGLILSLFY